MPALLVVPPIAPPGEVSFEWVDRYGVAYPLDVELEVQGLGGAGVDIADDKLPYASGSVPRHGSVLPVTTPLPLFFEAGSPAALEALLDDWHDRFATADERSLTPGYLRVHRLDGTVRQRAYYYRRGLEGDLAPARAGDTWQASTVELYAPDGAATDTENTATSVTFADLMASSALLLVMNAGRLPAYPVWTITGPMTSLVCTNQNTGRSWTIGLTVAAGTTLTIDTRPSPPRTTISVYDSAGVNRFASLSAGWDLWQLVPGANQILLQFTGAVGATTVQLDYLQRYRTLWR